MQLELNRFSLIFYNVDAKLLVDMLGHKYFSYLGQKLHQQKHRYWQGSVQPHVIALASEANCIYF